MPCYENILNDRVNICPAHASADNPVFFITSRAPAHVHVCDSPEAVYEWLSARFDMYDAPRDALDFEIVDLARS